MSGLGSLCPHTLSMEAENGSDQLVYFSSFYDYTCAFEDYLLRGINILMMFGFAFL